MCDGRAADHPLGLDADGERTAVADVHGDDGRLVEHDAAAADVHHRVGGAEVDRHVAAHDRREDVLGHPGEALSAQLPPVRPAQPTRAGQRPKVDLTVDRRPQVEDQPRGLVIGFATIGAVDAALRQPLRRPGNQSAISRAALSWPSRGVDEVLGGDRREVAADRAGLGVVDLGGADQLAHEREGVVGRTLDDHREHRRAGEERTSSPKNGLSTCSA